MAPLPTLCWHSLIACRCACRNRTVAYVAKVLWPTSCLLHRHPCRCQASACSAAPNGQGHRGSGWGQDPGAAACVLCPFHVCLAISAFSRLTRKGKCSLPLCRNLVVWVHPITAVPTSCTPSVAAGGQGCQGLEWDWDPGTNAPARPCRAASLPFGIAVVRPALLPLWLWHCHHCTLQWCHDPCCNGAVAPHRWHHHPHYNGAVAHAALAVGCMALPLS